MINAGDLMSLGLSLGLISLIVFGNIENLILASQGVVKAANPLRLAILSLICVAIWLILYFRYPINVSSS